MSHALQFDPKRHEYSIGGEVLLSVTQILALGGFVDYAFATEYARDRGSAVHEATRYFDEDDLDEGSVTPAIAPYLEAWKRFRKETGFVPFLIEKAMAHPSLKFAGTLDRFGGINGNSRPWLIDIKTSDGEPALAVRVQTAAYEHLLTTDRDFQVSRRQVIQRGCVILRGNGTYRLDGPYRDSADWTAFQGALAALAWQRAHCPTLYQQRVKTLKGEA